MRLTEQMFSTSGKSADQFLSVIGKDASSGTQLMTSNRSTARRIIRTDRGPGRSLEPELYANLPPVNHTALRHTLMAPKVRQRKPTKPLAATGIEPPGH